MFSDNIALKQLTLTLKQLIIMEKTRQTLLLFCSVFLLSFTQKHENTEGVKTNYLLRGDTSKLQETAIVRAVTQEERDRMFPPTSKIEILEAHVIEITQSDGKITIDTFVIIEHSNFKKYENKENNAPKVKMQSMDIDTTGTATYGSGHLPYRVKPEHCYAKCKLLNGTEDEWREVICPNKITKNIVHQLIMKLKPGGYLEASYQSDDMTKDLRMALSAYQTMHFLPYGNLNIATIVQLGIKL